LDALTRLALVGGLVDSVVLWLSGAGAAASSFWLLFLLAPFLITDGLIF
jgi:hypothetical protein